MAKYINRDSVLNYLNINSISRKIQIDESSIYDYIENLPAIDVVADVNEDVKSGFTVIIHYTSGHFIKIKDAYDYGYDKELQGFYAKEHEFTHYFNKEQVCYIGRETDYS